MKIVGAIAVSLGLVASSCGDAETEVAAPAPDAFDILGDAHERFWSARSSALSLLENRLPEDRIEGSIKRYRDDAEAMSLLQEELRSTEFGTSLEAAMNRYIDSLQSQAALGERIATEIDVDLDAFEAAVADGDPDSPYFGLLADWAAGEDQRLTACLALLTEIEPLATVSVDCVGTSVGYPLPDLGSALDSVDVVAGETVTLPDLFVPAAWRATAPATVTTIETSAEIVTDSGEVWIGRFTNVSEPEAPHDAETITTLRIRPDDLGAWIDEHPALTLIDARSATAVGVDAEYVDIRFDPTAAEAAYGTPEIAILLGRFGTRETLSVAPGQHLRIVVLDHPDALLTVVTRVSGIGDDDEASIVAALDAATDGVLDGLEWR